MARAGTKKTPHNANGRLIIQERPFARGALFPRGPSVVTSAPTALACDYATFPAGPSGAGGAGRVAGAGTAGVALAGGVGAACHAGWMDPTTADAAVSFFARTAMSPTRFTASP